MNDKFTVYPTRIQRSRKIMVKQYEPEEIMIEFAIELHDQSSSQEAIDFATKQAIAYLDSEEKHLRHPDGRYTLSISKEGEEFGNYLVKVSEDEKYRNYIHLWFQVSANEELYVGHLHRQTGNFVMKSENKERIKKLGIDLDLHTVKIRS